MITPSDGSTVAAAQFATGQWRPGPVGSAGRAETRPEYAARPVRYTNFALCAMHAHRLWINLWISLGHPAENRGRPGGKAPVTEWVWSAAHKRAARSTRVRHSGCARPRPSRAAQTQVIPGIHRPYDDYSSSYGRQIKIQVATNEPPSTPGFVHDERMQSEKEGDR
jgi:hypothetical protein